MAYSPRNLTKWDIFIAYHSKDRPHAVALFDLLKQYCSVFLDIHCLPGGSNVDTAIPEEQRRSRITVALVGNDYEAAYYLRTEVAAAVELSRNHPDEVTLVPVYLFGMPSPEDLPYPLRLKHAFDLVREGGWEPIVCALRELLGEPVSPVQAVPATSAGPGAGSSPVLSNHTAESRIVEVHSKTGDVTDSEGIFKGEATNGGSSDSQVHLNVEIGNATRSKIVVIGRQHKEGE